MEVYKRESSSQASSAIERGTVYPSEEQFYPYICVSIYILLYCHCVLFLYRLHPAESLVSEGECSSHILKRGRKNQLFGTCQKLWGPQSIWIREMTTSSETAKELDIQKMIQVQAQSYSAITPLS